ncbi:hypothetical protein GCM10009715_36260 [Paeniglutamicibacter psychrophenolicus]|uniref:Membrane protein n=1 Tax=Paeniglutamicibacter psychrophenolicus TaxID=257454 RepID=A0ABS4WAH9_9MICC|nr:DUF1304 family protein [Paeniglutamicibacter psychrophenolicus]MBP2373212.1 putative membrane protein [Paeniglutamicibacter psychrophenolicus]
MNAAALILAILEGILLLGIGTLEAFFFRKPQLYPIFLIRPEDHRAVRLWTVNVGWYNICSGLAIAVGLVLAATASADSGLAVVLTICAMQVVLGVVLVMTEAKLWRGAVGQALLPLAVILAAVLLN